jgi:hypothetical protein
MSYESVELRELLPRLRSTEGAWRDEDSGLVYVFNGGHTVNVWSFDGRDWANVDVFTFGNFALNNMTPEEAHAAILRHLQDESGAIRVETIAVILLLSGFAYMVAHVVAYAMRAMDTVGGGLG